jgi:hypothetical protein
MRASDRGMSSVTPVRRHPAPRVLGILSIVFGGIVVLMSLVGMSMSGLSTFEKLPGFDMDATQRYLDALEPAATILMMTMIAMSAGLIAIGIGQLRYRQWARKAALAWSVLGLVVIVGLVLHHYMLVMPATMVFLESLEGASDVRRMMEGMSGASAILSVVMYAPYPIIQLILMRKTAVIEAMDA